MKDPVLMLRSKMAGRSLRALSREIGCSAAYLSDIMRGNRAPGPKILAYLGLSREVKVRTSYTQTAA
jgi:transcriptional regulator with XRE-family HTH domain